MPLLTLRRSLDAVQVEPLAGPLFARHTTLRESIPWPNSGPGQLELQVFAGSEPTLELPPPRHPEFLKLAAKVSTQLQLALRAWLPLMWFSDPARFSDYDDACALLIYASCRTYTARDRTAYTFDVLDSDTPRAVIYSASRNLAPRLAIIHRMLTALGHPKANQYKPYHLDRVLATYQRKPHPLHSILVAERDLIEAYVTRGEWATNEKRREEADLAISRRLRRLLFREDLSELRPVLDAESQLTTIRLVATWRATNAPPAALPQHEDHNASLDARSGAPGPSSSDWSSDETRGENPARGIHCGCGIASPDSSQTSQGEGRGREVYGQGDQRRGLFGRPHGGPAA